VAAAALVLAASGAAASGTGGLGARFARPITEGALDPTLFDAAVAHYANAARRAHGRPALERDGRLLRAASGHARNMAALRTQSHRLPVEGAGRLAQRMDRNGVRYRTAAENIGMEKVLRLLGRPIAARASGCAFAYADDGAAVPVHTYASLAESAVARWMASPKHRASLLSPAFRRIGSAAAIDPAGPACGDVYLVQNFAD
jgi:uncharacterized protein YkwD